ncbi:hypothetical protein CN210_14830 [Sinorhizobium meliloti]|nr:hypothetical protein CN210_14830 [Sinorhizobium meliloti]
MNDRNGGAMLPFTDLSVDVALGADRVLLPRALRGMLLCCSLFGPRRSHNVSTGTADTASSMLESLLHSSRYRDVSDRMIVDGTTEFSLNKFGSALGSRG